uniref:Uncharacterized protein n=1 Tax=Siphoviridae sp. ct43U4 TaxID=2826285 RepID=A0A8S5N164_9CAUD|nr:MAG TPA: hypothetical protein [Siphoviridae sp. ct43U4]
MVDIGRYWKILEDDSKGVGDGGSFSGLKKPPDREAD